MRRLATALVCTCGFLYAEGAWAQAVDKGKIWDANRGAVVKIHTFGTGANNSPKSIDAGTGIFVSREGYILTALHVVGKDEDWSKVGPDHMPDRHVEVTLLNHAGSPHVISRNAYVKIIPGVDLALLRVDGHCFQYAKLAAQRPSGFPTLVAIVWGADTVPHPTSADLTEMTDVSLSGDKLTLDRIAAAGGYSGSPLFNAAGEVVGVLDNRLGDFRALAIPSTEAITSVQAITSVPVTNTDSNSCGPVPPVPDSLSIFYRLAGVEFGDPKDTVNSRFPHGTFDYHNNELLFYYRYKYASFEKRMGAPQILARSCSLTEW
jgi:S1-C subfamily serine protease